MYRQIRGVAHRHGHRPVHHARRWPARRTHWYYNFDVQPTAPAPIFVLFRQGETTPVANQLDIVDIIPGQAGYNDFWQVMKALVVPAELTPRVFFGTSVSVIRYRGTSDNAVLVLAPRVAVRQTVEGMANPHAQPLVLVCLVCRCRQLAKRCLHIAGKRKMRRAECARGQVGLHLVVCRGGKAPIQIIPQPPYGCGTVDRRGTHVRGGGRCHDVIPGRADGAAVSDEAGAAVFPAVLKPASRA